MIVFFYGRDAALTTDHPVPGSHLLDDAARRYYGGGRYFVAESMTRRTATAIASGLGGVLVDDWLRPSSTLPAGDPWCPSCLEPRCPDEIHGEFPEWECGYCDNRLRLISEQIMDGRPRFQLYDDEVEW